MQQTSQNNLSRGRVLDRGVGRPRVGLAANTSSWRNRLANSAEAHGVFRARAAKALGVLAVLGLVAGSAGTAAAFPITFGAGDYDNTQNSVTAGPTPVNNQTTGLFRDITWWSINNGQPRVDSPDYINQGFSLVSSGGSPAHAVPGSGPITALNFTGPAVSGGTSYLTIYDTTPGDGTLTRNLFDATAPDGLRVSADVLFTPGGHATSGGVVALYNEGQDALALLASNGGGNNQDKPGLSLVFQSAGQGITLTSVSLPGLTSFTADTWYRVTMDLLVNGASFLVKGSFQNHAVANDPNSPLTNLITALTFTGSLSDPDLLAQTHNTLVLTNPGEIGLIAMGNQSITGAGCPPPYTTPCTDNVGVSITNFDEMSPVPEPGTVFLAGTALIMLGFMARRRLFAR